MTTVRVSFHQFVDLVPPSLQDESGKVFYSGRSAFCRSATLYVLGVNPGGDPSDYLDETVGSHTNRVLNELPEDWSAYRDEKWEGAQPGTYGMAPRVLHLFKQLDLDPGAVPASNLIFVRSRRESYIRERQSDLTNLCWPFHARVIQALQPRVVLCLGGTAGKCVRDKLKANRLVDEFVEQNRRGWRSQAFDGNDDVRVVVATHPSIADWRAPATDPSELVLRALRR